MSETAKQEPVEAIRYNNGEFYFNGKPVGMATIIAEVANIREMAETARLAGQLGGRVSSEPSHYMALVASLAVAEKLKQELEAEESFQPRFFKWKAKQRAVRPSRLMCFYWGMWFAVLIRIIAGMVFGN